MYDKNSIDTQAECEGRAMSKALQPIHSNRSQSSMRIKLQAEYNKDKFDKLFKD